MYNGLEFRAQEHSNDALTSVVQRLENWLWYMANQTDDSGKSCLVLSTQDHDEERGR